MKTGIKIIAVLLAIILTMGVLPSCSVIKPILKNENKGLSDALTTSTNDLERVKEAVEAGADVNKVSAQFGPYASPLWYSIRNGQRLIPAYLLSKGADPNFVDDRGISILMFAVGADAEWGTTYDNATDNDSYKTLLNDKRTKINLKGKLGFTALDYACRDSGHLEKVNYLISHGAIITPTTMKCALEGFSHAHCDPPVLRLVLDSLIKQGIPSGLDPEIEAAILGDSSKLISLYHSGKIKQQKMQVLLFLTAAFCDANALKALTSKGANLSAFFNDDTLLSTASKYGKLETVEYLVSQHVDLESLQPDGTYDDSALTKAISCNRLDIAKYLHKSGAKFQSLEGINMPNALKAACENGSMDMIKWILDSGYPLTTIQETGALAYAAQSDRIDVLKYLLDDKKFDLNAESDDDSVLESALRKANFDTIKFLVDRGANVNGVKNEYSTPLTTAVMLNRADFVKYLIEKGADVNLAGRSSDGDKDVRPLTEAIQNGYFDMVKLLVDNGASVNYKEGWKGGDDTPIAIAKTERSKRIIAYIEAVGKGK